MTAGPAELKACCANAYGSAAARWLLGERLHPGGAELTAELVSALAVGRGDVVCDVACGPGASAVQLARETGCEVVGVDLSEESVAVARAAAAAAGLEESVTFVAGDAEQLPLPDAGIDGVLCECALCTFPDKPAAVGELARVLKPGARLALSDVTAAPDRLSPELQGLDAWVACLADARPLTQLAVMLEGAGFLIERAEQRDRALADLLARVRARLALAASAAPSAADRLRRGRELVGAAEAAVRAGTLGYGVLVARRP